MASKTIETRARTTKDGRLNLNVDVDVPDAEVAVVVTVTPVPAGSSADANGWPDTFLAPFSSLPFDDACAVKCAEIRRALERKGEMIGPHDLQIAAVALRHNLTLVTHNTREFSRIAALRLEDWE